jgi:preprotein translocase subunit SecY
MAIGLGKKGLLDTYNWQTILFMTCVWTLGSAVLILLSEKISKFEMGNGVSYILLLNILSSFPFDVFRVQERLVNRENAFASVLFMIIAGVVFLLFIAVAVFLNLSEKRIPIKFSRKSISGGNNDHLPVPLNVCNVMPIIFTGSIFSMISILAAFSKSTILVTITRYLTQSNWFDIKNPIYTIGTILYVILVFFFANFYLDIAFNSDEIAYRLKQQGATVPGIRPGNPTSEYLRKNAKEMKTIGTVIVLILVLGSTLLCNVLNIGVLSIGGTSILIVVNVIIESSKKLKTVAQSVKSTSYYSRNKKGSLFRSKGVKNV